MYQTATLEIELLDLPRISGPKFDLKSLLPRTSDCLKGISQLASWDRRKIAENF